MKQEVQRLADEYAFFHWHLAFPDVFVIPDNDEDPDNDQTGWSGGFHCVLGNPPWERIKLQEKEWFATRNPEIANAPNAAARRRRIQRLIENNPTLHSAFLAARRRAEGESKLVQDAGVFPLCGRGDVNTYAIFSELNRNIINPSGRMGCIVPSGIATDDTTKFFFQDLMEKRSLSSLFDFENRKGIFPGVHRSYKFCLLTLTGQARPVKSGGTFSFFALGTEDLKDPERTFVLSSDEIVLINPNTRTCPIFRNQRDLSLTVFINNQSKFLSDKKKPNYIYMDIGLRVDNSKESKHFVDESFNGEMELVPFYEGKMIHQFNHRFSSYSGNDYYLVGDNISNPFFQSKSKNYIPENVAKVRFPLYRDWYIGLRRLARSTDERTIIASVLPKCCPAYSFNTFIISQRKIENLFYLGSFNSFIIDYVSRLKLGGANVTWVFQKQIPLPCFIEQNTLCNQICKSVLEIVYTAWDLENFAAECGYIAPPFVFDNDRRFLIRCELDAAFFHLYGIQRVDVDYIMETFPIVKRKDEQAHGHYRTKDTILEIYDEMARGLWPPIRLLFPRTGYPTPDTKPVWTRHPAHRAMKAANSSQWNNGTRIIGHPIFTGQGIGNRNVDSTGGKVGMYLSKITIENFRCFGEGDRQI